MTDRDRASNLEFWAGRERAAGKGVSRAHKPYRRSRLDRLPFRLPSVRIPEFRRPAFRRPASRPRPGALDRGSAAPTAGRDRGRARPVAAAMLLAVLAGAWVAVGHRPHADRPATTATTTTATATTTARPGDAMSGAVLATSDCRGVSASRPHVRCVLTPGFVEEVALYTPATVADAFRRIAGTAPAARSGPAACASGRPDERAWSLASAPQFAVGRYLCRMEQGRAAMWWTHGSRLFHAVGNDADLAHVFAQWSARPSE